MEDRKAVLLVEDIRPIREALCTVLEAEGFDVTECEDGVSALAAASKRIFHVIITDFHIPVMNGGDVAKSLRGLFPDSIIIGLSSEDRSRDFLLAGADAFLLKPYRYDDLAKLINGDCDKNLPARFRRG